MDCILELELDVGSAPDQFVVHVVRPQGRERSCTIQLDVDGLLADRDELETEIVDSSKEGEDRGVRVIGERQLRRVGERLFEKLFGGRNGPVYDAYNVSQALAHRQEEELFEIVLRLDAPKLAALPWEALYDVDENAFICRREPMVRRVGAPYSQSTFEVDPPLRVLGIVAATGEDPSLNVMAEQNRLREALDTPISEGLLELEWLPDATWAGVHRKLLSGRWHVLHFIGHGDYDLDRNQGRIALVGAGGRPNMVDADRLADLLGAARPKPRLVVLNSCSTAAESGRDLFSGTAAALVRRGISAVAAMQFTISDSAALDFSGGFYGGIAHGQSIDEALHSGRIEILRLPDTLEWVTPVLYVRGDSTRIFTFKSSPEAIGENRRRRDLPAPERQREHSGVASRCHDLPEPEHRNPIDVWQEFRPHEPMQCFRVPGQLGALAWDPKGARIAAVGENTAWAWVYDCEGKKIAALKAGTWLSPCTSVAVASNGMTLATGSVLKRARIWDFGTGRLLRELHLQAAVQSVAFGPDGACLATAGTDHTARVWEVATGRQLREMRHESPVWSVAFSPDGTRLATACGDRAGRIWDMRTGGLLLEIRNGKVVESLAFSPDGARLATACADRAARIWDVRTGGQLLEMRHSDRVGCVAFSPDGTRLATACADRAARIWDARTGGQLLEMRHGDRVGCVAFSPDGARLATASGDCLAVWSTSRHRDKV